MDDVDRLHNLHAAGKGARAGIPERYPLLCRCPTADLTAVLSEDGALELRRTTRTQSWGLWKASAPKEARSDGVLPRALAVAWKPDGEVIGVAFSDGVIRYHAVNTGEVIDSIRVGPTDQSGSITFLQWVKLEPSGRKSKGRLVRRSRLFQTVQGNLPALMKMPSGTTSGALLHARVDQGPTVPRLLVERYGENLDVVIAGESLGNIYLCLFGVLCIPVSVPPFRPTQLAQYLMVDAELTRDFARIGITAVVHAPGSAPSPTDGETKQICVTLDASIIAHSAREIRLLAISAAQINFLLGYMTDCLVSLEREFRALSQLTSRNLNVLQELLDDNAVETTPAVEFALLIGRGIPSPSLDQYVQRELTDRTLNKWIELADLKFESLLRLATKQLQPACEQLILLLAELIGICRWEMRSYNLGLNEKQLHSCIRLAGSLMARLEEFSLKVHVEADNFAVLFAWLKNVKSSPEEPTENVDTTKVISSLEHSVNATNLAPFFKSSEPEQQSVLMFLPKVEFENNEHASEASTSQSTLPSTPRVVRAAKGARMRARRTALTPSAEHQSPQLEGRGSPTRCPGHREHTQSRPSALPAYPVPFVTPPPVDDLSELRNPRKPRSREADVIYPTLKFHAESLADRCFSVLEAASAAIGSQIHVQGDRLPLGRRARGPTSS